GRDARLLAHMLTTVAVRQPHIDVYAFGDQRLDHRIALDAERRATCRVAHLDDAAHPPVVPAAPGVAVVRVRARLVECQRDLLDMTRVHVPQVDAEPRPNGDAVRHIDRAKAQGDGL